MKNGLYDVKLTAKDASGNTASTTRTYQLEGEMKVGNFTISFNDLTIPVAGIPITITRTYDSRVKTKGDFGVGWTLDIKNIELSESGIMGKDWQLMQEDLLPPTYSLKTTKPHYITVTFPNGRTDEFNMVVNPSSKTQLPLLSTTASFTPAPGTFSSLVSLDNNSLMLSDVLGAVALRSGSGLYNPNRYQLTDEGGTVYIINQRSGLESIKDTNGNTINFASDGIIHSAGKSVTFTRDSEGRVTTIADPMGNTIQYQYDYYGDLISVTDQEGNTTQFTYNFSHGLIDIIAPRGITPARNEYDNAGRLIATVDAEGNRIEFTHNVDARQELVRDRLGNVTVYEYDDNGNVISKTDTLGNRTGYTYDARSNKLSETDALGNTTTYTYDAHDNMLSRINPLGNTTTCTYDAKNNKLSETDALGNTETYTYDAKSNKLSETDPLGNVTTYTYDAAGNQTSKTDALGNTTTYTYDAAGRNTSVTDALGNTTTYEYDANGNQIRMTDANGNVTLYEYDANNLRTRTIFPDGTSISVTYDALGNKIAETDQAGNTTQFEYDALGRFIKVTDALGNLTTYTYDEMSNLLTQTDANGNITSYEYDSLGRRLKRILPLGMEERKTYDQTGRVISQTDFNGETITFEYDEANRLTKKTFPDGAIETYTYTATGQRETVTDSRGGVTTYECDGLDRIIRRIDPDGKSISYAYDAAGNRTSVTTPSGTTNYTYDALNRLSTVTDPDGGVTTYTYDAVGNRASVIYPNGTVTEYTYDSLEIPHVAEVARLREVGCFGQPEFWQIRLQKNHYFLAWGICDDSLNRLTNLVNRQSGSGIISSYVYTLGPAGNRTRVVEDTGRTVDYSYDATYKLVQESINDPVSGSRVIDYTYDPVGNRLTKMDSGVTSTYTYDTNDRLLTEDGITYAYDDNGNTLSKVSGAETVFYTYDSQNRLIQADTTTSSGNSVVEYLYDVDGNRVQKIVDGTNVTNYLVDTNRVYSQVLEERNVIGALLVSYVYADDLISQNRGGSVSYYHYDGQMSTRKLTDTGETVTDSNIRLDIHFQIEIKTNTSMTHLVCCWTARAQRLILVWTLCSVTLTY